MLSNGRPLTLAWEKENIETIVETWFLGTEAGNAVADVLFGKYNPSGKLVMSFPYNVGQIPVYYNHKHTGRPFEPNQRYVMHYIDARSTRSTRSATDSATHASNTANRRSAATDGRRRHHHGNGEGHQRG